MILKGKMKVGGGRGREERRRNGKERICTNYQESDPWTLNEGVVRDGCDLERLDEMVGFRAELKNNNNTLTVSYKTFTAENLENIKEHKEENCYPQ